MTPEQVRLVKQSYLWLAPVSGEASRMFYDRLFEIAPELRGLFKSDMRSQGRKLMATLNTLVNSIDLLETLRPALRELARKHERYGVKVEDFAPFREALIWMLRERLGKAFLPETEAAWRQAYAEIADILTDEMGAEAA